MILSQVDIAFLICYVFLCREQVLKRRLTAVRESLDTALADSATRRRYSEEERAQLVLAHR